MSGVLMWAWDDTNKKWIKIQVTASGHLIVKKG